MNAESLLERLEGVKECGPGRWLARCPAHDDRSPSLSIKEVDDRILVFCFGACSTGDVLAAVGLTLSDLFEKPLDHHKAPARDRRHQHAAREALKSISTEAVVVAVAAENIAKGIALDAADRKRLLDAAVRVRLAREAVTWAS